jgi:arylsulfatase A-like enzyme
MFWSLLLACSQAPPEPVVKPDIVLVVVDTLRADHLGVYGHLRPTSPTMDQLAEDGTWFYRAYSQSGWTLPSMASLLSGLYPHQHLVGRHSFRGNEFGKLDPKVTTLAEALKTQGYATGAVVNNTFMAPEFDLKQGFDSYDYKGATNVEHRSARESIDLGMKWMDQQDGSTFLLLHFMEPHLNYEATPPYLGTFSKDNPAASDINLGELVGKSHRKKAPSQAVQEYVRQRYDEEILVVDDAMAYLLSELQSRSRWSNTALAITSDHGEEFWDHGGFEHGHTLKGELTRIPLILAGAVPKKGRVNDVVEHVDLVHGLLSLVGAPMIEGAPGVDLWKIADGTAKDADGIALSENILYGPPRVSAVDKHARLEFAFEANAGSLWVVGADGLEREPVAPDLRQATGNRLSEAIKSIRGGLQPIDGSGGVSIEDYEMFNQLQSLGYIEAPKPSPPTPTGASNQQESAP